MWVARDREVRKQSSRAWSVEHPSINAEKEKDQSEDLRTERTKKRRKKKRVKAQSHEEKRVEGRGGEKLKGQKGKLCVKLKRCEMCESVKRRAEA